jgi:hypothetical protein
MSVMMKCTAASFSLKVGSKTKKIENFGYKTKEDLDKEKEAKLALLKRLKK